MNQLSRDKMVWLESLRSIMNIERLTRNDWFGTGPVPIWMPYYFGGILPLGEEGYNGETQPFYGSVFGLLGNTKKPSNVCRWLARVTDGRCMGIFAGTSREWLNMVCRISRQFLDDLT